ncbi:hypothetical protein evm_007579 [Chilo suppressalis]|nr:hypothetical protein evm_007579 [Chilo suppressalis]
MDTAHYTDFMTKEAIEFGEWVSRVEVPRLLRERKDPAGRRRRSGDMEIEYASHLRYRYPSLITIRGFLKWG